MYHADQPCVVTNWYLDICLSGMRREKEGWKYRMAQVSWLKQHAFAPSDFPPFLVLAHISSSHTPTQSPHTAPFHTGGMAPLPCT